MQPYVDLVHGDSPPQRSLLLDYTRTNNFIVWGRAAKHKHYLVALASLMVLLSLTFQPLAAALLVVNDVWWSVPNQTMQTVQQVGLNQNLQFDDLTSFLTAAGFSSASVLYNLPNPPFTLDGYTVAEFQLPTNVLRNGTVVSANTTAMRSDPGCVHAPVDMVRNADGSEWTNTVNGSNGCSIVFNVDKSSTTLFGTDTVICDNDQPDQFRPIVFWFFTYQPTPAASATLCFPSFTLWDVNVKVDLGSGNITKVTQLQPFSSSSNFSSLSANVTGAPLNGRAYNGIQFNLTDPDPFVLARRNATQLQMPAAVYQSAVQSPEGLVGSFEADRFVRLSTNVYRTYLTLIAKKVYFLDAQDPIDVSIMTIQPRVFLSDVAVHLLAVAMLILAFFATIIQLLHRQDRRNLRLQHEPGTIASAVAIGAQTGMGDLLAGRQRESDMNEALKNRRFRIDPRTMKIFMEGEEGYEWAKTPTEAEKYDRRKSIFATMQGQKGDFAVWRHPKSPKSPK
ncbi:hypothetical protein CPB85DRAFT_1274646 [Mucidula mucida]|nr:hypothetical protein CPB85DRAFT_1274646 [Mucidula mucida]